jgi:hypothetical protein
MTMCPLPIDWLDLLEGRPSPASRAHLTDCARCRNVVAALDSAAVAEPLSLRGTGGPRPLPTGDDIADVSFGDIRWLAPADADVRLPVLVLGVVDDADGAVDVVPLSLDRDAATSVDLLLGVDESTSGVPWRLAFRHQTLAAAEALGGRFSVLTGAGVQRVDAAKNGAPEAERSGPDLESDHDPRLRADEWMRTVLTAATPTWASEDDDESGEPVPPTAAATATGQVLRFELRWRTGATFEQLAAATSRYQPQTRWATVDTPWGVHVNARLLMDHAHDALLLDPVEVHGLDRPVILVVHTSLLDHPLTLTAILREGEPVVVATSDSGISEHDVDYVEMLLP